MKALAISPANPSRLVTSDVAYDNAGIYMSGNGGGTWREQAAGCSSTSCPLFALRPLPRYASGAAATRWRDPVHVRQFAQHQPEAFRAALRNDCGATGEAV